MPLKQLDSEAAAAFDAYTKARESKRKLYSRSRSLDKQRKEHEALIVAAMGRSKRAALPDGRIIKIETTSQHCKAQPARDVEWVTITEEE